MKSKYWGYRAADAERSGQFVMLANANRSSSCRLFDAQSGARIAYETSGRGTYDGAYASVLRACKELVPPPGVKTSDLQKGLPPDPLSFLQRQIGMYATPLPVTAPSPAKRGMLAGTQEIIDAALGLHVAFDTETAAKRLSESRLSLDAPRLLNQLYERVTNNWDGSPGRSKVLWRSCPMPYIKSDNDSPEKTLEKAIAESVPGWFNQIPTASGLLLGVEEKHRNVDLGHFLAPGHLELIELKVGRNADTPLKAAFELIGYGLLYCFARTHRGRLNLPKAGRVMDAQRVDLKVLAPLDVYAGYSLGWLGTSLDAGLHHLASRLFPGSLQMGFYFEFFPDGFRWPGTPAYELPAVLEGRKPVKW
jgi:hypothetical protein